MVGREGGVGGGGGGMLYVCALTLKDALIASRHFAICP